MFGDARLPPRFWDKVQVEEEHWIWVRGKIPDGYGVFKVKGKSRLAHRVAYEALVGPIGEKLEIDHKCRIRACVNPRCLEPVTQAENARRGADAITHCPQGHAYVSESTYVDAQGTRFCKICRRAQDRRRNATDARRASEKTRQAARYLAKKAEYSATK